MDGMNPSCAEMAVHVSRPRVTSTCRVHVSRPRVASTCGVHVSQVSTELEEWAAATYGLDRGSELSVAACGLKLISEHEDSLIVTVELLCEAERAKAVRARMEEGFVREAAKGLSKGARPDRLRFGQIPRNFKGAVLAKELAAACAGDFPRQSE